jgi:hypothetical protein
MSLSAAPLSDRHASDLKIPRMGMAQPKQHRNDKKRCKRQSDDDELFHTRAVLIYAIERCVQEAERSA